LEVFNLAHSRSAKKRVLVAERNRERNQAVKSRVKTMTKKVLTTVDTKDVEAAKAALSVAYKELDKAVSKGIMKKNTASRKKARLAAKVNAL
jgi:small subunit ribosomal protein S20